MKKIIVMLTAVLAMAFSGLAMAADGSDLNKQQAAAEVFMKAFTLETPTYSQFSKGFDAELKTKLNEQVYAALQEQVKEKFGRMKEAKFHSFQRFDKVDYVTYVAGFTKEKVVSITLVYNKDNKMVNFSMNPLQVQE